MKEMLKNKKVVYGIIAAILFIGLIVASIFKFNFSLMYKEHTRITIYLGKEYNIKDIEKIGKEVFDGRSIQCEKLEIYDDTPVINVENPTQDELKTLEDKIKEKYELQDKEELIKTKMISNIRGRDIVKPYIIPVIIASVLILAYVIIRYRKLGMIHLFYDFVFKILAAETIYLSLLAILRIPIGIYTMPIAILIYIVAIILCVYNYQIKIDKVKE